MTRASRTWWIGIALGVFAGLCAAAPRADASCTASHFSFTVPALPFGDSFDQPASAPRAAAPKQSDSKPAPCPCKGPHCQTAPSAPMSPPSAPPQSSSGQNWAWVESPALPPHRAGAPFAAGNGLRASLFVPSPLERPPR